MPPIERTPEQTSSKGSQEKTRSYNPFLDSPTPKNPPTDTNPFLDPSRAQEVTNPFRHPGTKTLRETDPDRIKINKDIFDKLSQETGNQATNEQTLLDNSDSSFYTHPGAKQSSDTVSLSSDHSDTVSLSSDHSEHEGLLPKHQADTKSNPDQYAQTLEKQQKLLTDINKNLDAMMKDDRYAKHPDLQRMARDTKRDMQKNEVLLNNRAMSPEQLAQQNKIMKNQLKADKLVENDKKSTATSRVNEIPGIIPGINYIVPPTQAIVERMTGKTLGGLHNKRRHIEGAKLREKYRSADAPGFFKEKDWKVPQLEQWNKEIETRAKSLETLKTNKETDYVSRYQALESGRRLPSPKDVPEEARPEIREAILDYKQELRPDKSRGEKEPTEQRIREIAKQLPDREIEKLKPLIDKEVSYQNGTSERKSDRTTTFEGMSLEYLTQLQEEFTKQTDAKEHESKLTYFMKDISNKENRSSTTIRSKDFLRAAVGKSPKNRDYTKAYTEAIKGTPENKGIPENLRGLVFLRLHEKAQYQIWQELDTRASKFAIEVVNKLSKDDVKSLLAATYNYDLVNNGTNKSTIKDLKDKNDKANEQLAHFVKIVKQSKHGDLLPEKSK